MGKYTDLQDTSLLPQPVRKSRLWWIDRAVAADTRHAFDLLANSVFGHLPAQSVKLRPLKFSSTKR